MHEIKSEILELTEKYSLKCVEASKLGESVNYLKTQLNEAKRRILDLEGNGFQNILTSAKVRYVEDLTMYQSLWIIVDAFLVICVDIIYN